MPFPVFISEVRASATDTIQAGAGSVQTLPDTCFYFYFSSGHVAAVDGCSLLFQLKTSADASSAVVWTFVLDANLKLKVTHNNGGTVNLFVNRILGWNLGLATGYPPDPSVSLFIAVPPGASGFTAPYRSPWLWSPERLISSVGPELFDPAISPGIKTAIGSAARAPDSTVSILSSPVVTEASFTFLGVNPLYRARHTHFDYSDTHEREDFETWWQYGPRLGRRFLFWRDKSLLPGSSWVGSTGTIGPRYVEYYPTQALVSAPTMKASAPPNLVYWDITVPGWLTEHGETLY